MQRLSKIMAERNLCSRREADSWIAKGWVRVGGKLATLGQKCENDIIIELSTRAKNEKTRNQTILLHKPVGVVSAQPEKGYEPAIKLLTRDHEWNRSGHPETPPIDLEGLAVAGRLDIDSSGLLVFTQDGVLAKKLIGETSEMEKEYLVRVEGEIDSDGLSRIRHGLITHEHHFKPAVAEWLNHDQLRIILREGKKRQVRKMCEEVGLRVTGLKRVRIGNISLGALPLGQWRRLDRDEAFD